MHLEKGESKIYHMDAEFTELYQFLGMKRGLRGETEPAKDAQIPRANTSTYPKHDTAGIPPRFGAQRRLSPLNT